MSCSRKRLFPPEKSTFANGTEPHESDHWRSVICSLIFINELMSCSHGERVLHYIRLPFPSHHFASVGHTQTRSLSFLHQSKYISDFQTRANGHSWCRRGKEDVRWEKQMVVGKGITSCCSAAVALIQFGLHMAANNRNDYVFFLSQIVRNLEENRNGKREQCRSILRGKCASSIRSLATNVLIASVLYSLYLHGRFAVLTLHNCYRLVRKQAVNITLISLLQCVIRLVQLVSCLLKSRSAFVLKQKIEVITVLTLLWHVGNQLQVA